MGCPKEFSIKGGMGAALLTQPEKVKDVSTVISLGMSIWAVLKSSLSREGWGQHFSHNQRRSKM